MFVVLAEGQPRVALLQAKCCSEPKLSWQLLQAVSLERHLSRPSQLADAVLSGILAHTGVPSCWFLELEKYVRLLSLIAVGSNLSTEHMNATEPALVHFVLSQKQSRSPFLQDGDIATSGHKKHLITQVCVVALIPSS